MKTASIRQRIFSGLCWASAMLPVLLIGFLLVFLFWQSHSALGLSLIFGDTHPWDAIFHGAVVWDGIWPACVGTFCVILLACCTAIPLGILCGIHLAEYARPPFKNILSFSVDLLAGVPSILMGLFGFALILFLRHTLNADVKTSLLLSGFCMGLLILPYMINATYTTLAGLPESLRLLGPSLGFSKVQTIRHILLPAAGRGIMSGVILGIGRAAEDTAVIMLTGVVANAGMPRGLLDKYEALPFYIFTTAAEYRGPEDLARGFGAALVLLLLTTGLFVCANLLQQTLQRRWQGMGGSGD